MRSRTNRLDEPSTNGPRSVARAWPLRVGVLIVCFALGASAALAGPREQARRMHDRLVGVPPSAQTLQTMADLISQGQPIEAANEAMLNPSFYNLSLKNWVTPWTNVSQSPHAPLNDVTATVIGIIRDDRPFISVLTANAVYYAPNAGLENGYAVDSNDHYEEFEAMGLDLSDPSVLVRDRQSDTHPELTSADAAGVLTLRAWAEAYLSAGTNRRSLRFMAMNFMCRDMEGLHDITRPTDRIRQDVTRSPGGDSSVFLNQCSGCHSGMDPMAQAFAYIDWDDELGRLVHTPGEVRGKYLINQGAFPLGFVTTDDAWTNFWRSGPNSALGWSDTLSGAGNGAKTLGAEVARSRAFSVCQVEKAFEHVCLRPVSSQSDRDEVDRIADVFEAEQHDMKRVFAEVATSCMGQ